MHLFYITTFSGLLGDQRLPAQFCQSSGNGSYILNNSVVGDYMTTWSWMLFILILFLYQKFPRHDFFQSCFFFFFLSFFTLVDRVSLGFVYTLIVTILHLCEHMANLFKNERGGGWYNINIKPPNAAAKWSYPKKKNKKRLQNIKNKHKKKKKIKRQATESIKSLQGPLNNTALRESQWWCYNGRIIRSMFYIWSDDNRPSRYVFWSVSSLVAVVVKTILIWLITG